jgi:CheY-like chemotaxis protein
MTAPDREPHEKHRILLIDDEAEFTDLLRLNLQRTGRFEVAVVNDPARALHTAQVFQPDVVLLDIVMPGIDGGDVASSFRADPSLKDTPIILVSALVSNRESGDEELGHSGDKLVLGKPVKLEKLIKAIDQSLAGR